MQGLFFRLIGSWPNAVGGMSHVFGGMSHVFEAKFGARARRQGACDSAAALRRGQTHLELILSILGETLQRSLIPLQNADRSTGTVADAPRLTAASGLVASMNLHDEVAHGRGQLPGN